MGKIIQNGITFAGSNDQANQINYSNSSSGLTATNVQNAIDELASRPSGGSTVTVDSTLSSTSTNPIQNKAVNTALANKVDKDGSKVLSDNNYTTVEKNKLAGIAEGANKVTVNNTLTSTSTTEALSAAQGKSLKDSIDDKADSSHTQSASTISTGTFTGAVYANAEAVKDLSTPQVRNIIIGTSDLTAGTSALNSGDVYIVYE